MKSQTKKTILTAVVCSLFLCALVFATIFDLQINKNVVVLDNGEYFSSNPFVAFFEIFGEVVLYAIFECACAIVAICFLKKDIKTKWQKIVFVVGFVLLGIGACAFGAHKTFENIAERSAEFELFANSLLGKIVVLGIGVAVFLLTFFVMLRISFSTLSKLFWWATIAIAVCITSNLVVQALKIVWGRTRYRAMIFEGFNNFEYYTPWYKINTTRFASASNFLSDYFKSFPSGHACAAASTFLLAWLPDFANVKHKKVAKICLFSFATTYTILTMIARIVSGAHFLSDVLVGAGIVFFATQVAFWIFFSRNKNNNQKHSQNNCQN